MSPRRPLDFHCDECETLLRELLAARQADLEETRKRLLRAARSSGRRPEEMRDAWLSSIAGMPDDEMRTVMRALYPRSEEARRRKLDHEAATGHSVDALASAVLLRYHPRPVIGSE